VTGPVIPIDINLVPPRASTSGCEATDFAGLDFSGPTDIALIQRGTCTFADKATNAEAAGAEAVIIFNQGNTPDRETLIVGTLAPATPAIPVVGASFADGEALAQAGSTAHVRVDPPEPRTDVNVTAIFMVYDADQSTLPGPGPGAARLGGDRRPLRVLLHLVGEPYDPCYHEVCDTFGNGVPPQTCPQRLTQRSCQNSTWKVSSTWGCVGVDTSRETTCPPAPWNLPEPPVIGSVKFSDRLTIVPWVVICPPGRIEVVGHWASTRSALAVDTNVQTTPTRPTCSPFRRRLPENTTSSPRLKPGAPTSILASNSVNTASTRIVWRDEVDADP
jgi:hypothetical protein